jgi:hypothetical protein
MLVKAASAESYGQPGVVRVAKGTYKPKWLPMVPTAGAPYTYTIGGRDAAFILRAGVEVYGGYTEGDNSDEATRNNRFDKYGTLSGDTYRAVLSGDFIGNDEGNAEDGFIGMGENAYHVVISVNIPNDGATVLDGFTIRGGNADGNSNESIKISSNNFFRNFGGGLYNILSSPQLRNITLEKNWSKTRASLHNFYSSPVLSNSTISGNRTDSNGGGIYNSFSSPTLNSVKITSNYATSSGGGMYNTNSGPVLINVQILGNRANNGGGMSNYNESELVLTNVLMAGNSAISSGAIYNLSSSELTLTNVTIAGNKASNNNSSGGIASANTVTLNIRNSIIWGNTAGTGSALAPSSLVNNGCTANIAYSLIEGSGGSGGTWLSAYGTDGGNNLDAANTQFIDWIDPSQGGWTVTTGGDYRLKTVSPASIAIDAGNNDYYDPGQIPDLHSITTDLGGNPRIQGTAPSTVDMGAYENQ